MSDQESIRALATEHIQDLGLVAPPFDHFASLEARELSLMPESLETVLADSNLPEDAQNKIDGFIDLEGRCVCLRNELHPHQYRTAVLHEVAHEVIPWQRELVHYCPIFSLPIELQRDFEREANLFAVECLFFADRFVRMMQDYPNHLTSAVTLAQDHAASYEMTFRHYVECQTRPCLLLISTLDGVDQRTGNASFRVRQYIKSQSGNVVIQPGSIFSSPELSQFVSASIGFPSPIEHEVILPHCGGRRCVAQSFWNTYKLFTLIWL